MLSVLIHVSRNAPNIIYEPLNLDKLLTIINLSLHLNYTTFLNAWISYEIKLEFRKTLHFVTSFPLSFITEHL